MKAKTFGKILDHLFWWLIYLMPLILWLVRSSYDSSVTFGDVIPHFITVFSSNFVYSSIETVLSTYFDVVFTSHIMKYICYFVFMNVTHLFIDVLLWIPRFCHNLLDKSLNIRGLDYEK